MWSAHLKRHFWKPGTCKMVVAFRGFFTSTTSLSGLCPQEPIGMTRGSSPLPDTSDRTAMMARIGSSLLDWCLSPTRTQQRPRPPRPLDEQCAVAKGTVISNCTTCRRSRAVFFAKDRGRMTSCVGSALRTVCSRLRTWSAMGTLPCMGSQWSAMRTLLASAKGKPSGAVPANDKGPRTQDR
jgi:hypothetical protein